MAARYFEFNPTQYQSQFDPTPANILQSGLGMRQKRFDDTQQQISQFQESMANIPFLDPEARQQFDDNMRSQLDDVYTRHAGDLSAAKNDIVRTLSTLRQDPYLNLNRRHLEQAQLHDQARAKDPNNFIRINDPSQVRLSEVTDPRDVTAQYATRSDYTKDIATNFAGLRDRASEIITKKGPLSDQYFQQIQQRGLAGMSDEDINAVVSDQDVKNFQARTTFDIDPNLSGVDAKRFILETLDSITPSQEQSKFIRNLDYLDAGTRARTGKTKEVKPSEYLNTTAQNTAGGNMFKNAVVDNKGNIEDEVTFDEDGNISAEITGLAEETLSQISPSMLQERIQTRNKERREVLDNYRNILNLNQNVTDKDLNDLLVKAEKGLSELSIKYERLSKKETTEITPNVLEELRTGARQTFIHKMPDGRNGDATPFLNELNDKQSKEFDSNFKVIGNDISDIYTPDGLYAVSHYYDGDERKTVEMTLEEPEANQNKLEYQLKRTLYDPELRRQGQGPWVTDSSTPNQFLRSIVTIGKNGKYELRYILRNPGGETMLTQSKFKQLFD